MSDRGSGHSQGGGADPEAAPKWIEALIASQTASLSSAISKQLSSFLSSKDIDNPAPKRPMPIEEVPSPKKSTSRPRSEEDEDDEFDAKFSHLFSSGVCEPRPPLEESDYGNEIDSAGASGFYIADSDGEASQDDDLVDILDKVPNWDTGSSITSFIKNKIDVPLPEEMLKQLNEDYMPNEDLQAYFLPPKMPPRLFNALARMKSKGTYKTEKALYTAQSHLFTIAKPLVVALVELKPLGSPVSKARELMSISLHGMYSVSLGISRARRENVRFLFKDALAEVLYSYVPSHMSLFGGSSFTAQVEKAAKEAKLDFTWSARNKRSYHPFRSSQQGFQNSRGSGRYFGRFPPRGRKTGSRGRSSTYRGDSGRPKGASGKSKE